MEPDTLNKALAAADKKLNTILKSAIHTEKDDLVERLHTACKSIAAGMDENYGLGGFKTAPKDAHPLMWEAATRITDLERELAEARGYMDNIELLASKMMTGKVSYISAILESVRMSRRAARAMGKNGE